MMPLPARPTVDVPVGIIGSEHFECFQREPGSVQRRLERAGVAVLRDAGHDEWHKDLVLRRVGAL